MSAGLAVVFVCYTLLVVYWSPFIHLDDDLNRNFHVQALWPVLSKVDRIGQASPLNWRPDRTFCLPIVGLVALFAGWRYRSLRPVALALLTVGAENLFVSIPKFALGRGRPLSEHSFFSSGDLYPSGHTANMVAYYGLCYYLITRYGKVSDRVRRWVLNVVVGLSVIMFLTSLLMRWHWFSDLVGGLMVGGCVLALIIGIDALLPSRAQPAEDSEDVVPGTPAEASGERVMAPAEHRAARGYSLSRARVFEHRRSG